MTGDVRLFPWISKSTRLERVGDDSRRRSSHAFRSCAPEEESFHEVNRLTDTTDTRARSKVIKSESRGERKSGAARTWILAGERN